MANIEHRFLKTCKLCSHGAAFVKQELHANKMQCEGYHDKLKDKQGLVLPFNIMIRKPVTGAAGRQTKGRLATQRT